MRIYTLLIALLFYGPLPLQGQQTTTLINVPITTVNGYGPFGIAFSRFTPELNDGSNWSKMNLPVKGIPKHWTNVEKAMARINTWQLIYQNVLKGTVPRSWYVSYQQDRKLALNDAQFSKQPIKCYVYLLRGFDQTSGKWVVMVDTNNNLDFSDETPFEAEVIKPGTMPDNITDARLITYQSYQKGKIVTARIPLVVKRMGYDLFFCFPQYARASLRQADESIDLLITSGFAGLNYEEYTSIAQQPRWFWQTKIAADNLTELGDMITLGGRNYRNRGVNTYTNTLQLEALPTGYVDYSLRTGRPFRSFTAREFTTGNPISLTGLKGKYVYVDFWYTGCAPCVAAMPTLKKLYRSVDKNRFEFLGVVGADTPDRLRAFLKKHNVAWPHVFSTGKTGLVDQYHISKYPTSVLLDPDGNVVATDLSMEQLEAKLNELSN
ncbi:TlpA family protein disulfide reductase [Spirosoma agri]|uniref:TlpA family protein disulfide reductase n=1 Tax=Spirosoma agri TaxID=1987381 RepID=A0A6M0IT78_9BACT|nr:TlpA disulfide reductase family protein [Spirosoma agri]NEU70915.1 TlpA family protein disulfide reductase [Spirosoma agri]